MISDVYRERAHQKQVRERRAALEKFRDERIQAELDRQNAEAIAAERAAIDERRRIDQQIAQTQIEQFAEYKRARRARLRATVEEGLRLAKQAKEAHKEEIRKNAERKQSIKEQKLAALGDNFRLRAIRDEERRKAEDELAKIKAYAEEKERKGTLRRASRPVPFLWNVVGRAATEEDRRGPVPAPAADQAEVDRCTDGGDEQADEQRGRDPGGAHPGGGPEAGGARPER